MFKIFDFLSAELRTLHSVRICIEVRHSESVANILKFKINTFAPQLKTVDKLFLYCYHEGKIIGFIYKADTEMSYILSEYLGKESETNDI